MSAASTKEEQSKDSGRKRFLNIWVPVAVMLVVFVCFLSENEELPFISRLKNLH